MVAVVRLRLGDQFEDQSDLIVLPCDTNGKVTDSLADRLHRYDITVPEGPYAHGKVVSLSYNSKKLTAKYIAFAATVSVSAPTTEDVISAIGNSLGEFTRTCSIH
jgi:hypothetical protein